MEKVGEQQLFAIGFLKRAACCDHAILEMCIFLLTLVTNNSIYESHCDFQIAKFDGRRITQ